MFCVFKKYQEMVQNRVKQCISVNKGGISLSMLKLLCTCNANFVEIFVDVQDIVVFHFFVCIV